jgi:tetratricopeptide (TPR) repeat protein
VLKRTADSLAAYDKAIALKRDYAEAYINRGTALNELKRPTEALASFEKAIALKRGLPEAYAGRAQALLELKRPSEAFASCNKALAIRSNFAKAYNYRGKALRDLKRLDEALANFDIAIKHSPNYAGAYVNRGLALNEWGKSREAEEALRQALRLNPEHAGAFMCLAQQLGKLNIDDPLVEKFERLKTRSDLSNDERKQICFGLGAIYDRAKCFDQAFENFRIANALERNSIDFNIDAESNWQSGIRSALDRAYFNSHPSSDLHTSSPIFIVGMPRSGTTLMEQILAAHPMIEGAGELTTIGEMLSEYSKKNWWLYPQSLRNLTPSDFRAMGRDYIRRARKLVTKPGGKRIVDKMPHNFLYVGFIKQILPAAKIIHMDRDPLDIVTSIFSLKFHGHHPYAYDLDELAEYVALSQKMMAHWHNVFPGQIFRQDYAALVENPEQEIRNVLEYLAVPFDETCLAPQKVERSVRTASVTQIREPINRNSIGRWRNYKNHFGEIVAKFAADRQNSGNTVS